MININTNTASLVASRALKLNARALEAATESLSTGRRISRASDDSSGLAISQSMSAAVRGLDVAMRNANDGIAFLQTADGILEDITSGLQRMRELSVQASTGTLSSVQRGHIQTEAEALADQINSTLATATWNGIPVFGSPGLVDGLEFQIGFRGHPVNVANSGGADTVTVTGGSRSVVIKDPGHGLAVGELVRVTSSEPVAGVTLSWRSRVLAVSPDGSSFTVSQSFGPTAAGNGQTQGSGGRVTWQRAVGSLGVRLGVQLQALSKSVLLGPESDLGSPSRSSAAIQKIDGAMATLSSVRAQLGTTVNFLARNVSISLELFANVQQSMSRILDTDYASATAELARAQILQQAGTAILAQANQQARAVLSLLRS